METLVVPNFDAGREIVEFGHTLGECEKVELDFSHIGFAKPAGMILSSQFIKDAVEKDKIQGYRGTVPHGYPANMGFFECCGLDVPRHDAPGGENYLPLQSVNLEDWRDSAKKTGMPFGEIANQRVGRMAYLISRTARGDLFVLVKYCLQEIVRNAMEHSLGGTMWLAGQYWPAKNEVQLCIYDDGIGIRRGITENKKFASITSDRDAIRLAIMPSISGKKSYDSADEIEAQDETGDWGNSGFGLYVTSQLARTSGYFVIGSGASYQQISGAESRKGDFGLRGTYIAMQFNVEGLQRTATRVGEIVEKGESFAKRHFASGAEVTASAASKILIG